jgi:hypothetical protein
MPPPIYTQNVIAMIWDFDKTLTHGYMQSPLFKAYGVDPDEFWDESNGLQAYYGAIGCNVSADTVYLNHILTYVREGRFPDLTNKKLRELGSQIELAPGLPEFFEEMRSFVSTEDAYRRHEISLEH